MYSVRYFRVLGAKGMQEFKGLRIWVDNQVRMTPVAVTTRNDYNEFLMSKQKERSKSGSNLPILNPILEGRVNLPSPPKNFHNF